MNKSPFATLVSRGKPTGCPTPIETQIASLKGLSPGWLDGEGTAYDPAALDWLARLLKGILDGFRLPTPYLYPTPEGLARLEWSTSRWEVIVNVDLEARFGRRPRRSHEQRGDPRTAGDVRRVGCRGSARRFPFQPPRRRRRRGAAMTAQNTDQALISAAVSGKLDVSKEAP